MRGPDPRREAYWREIVARQAESGLNGAQFCQRENLSRQNFYLWKRKLRERDAGSGVSEADPDGSSAMRFVPVQIESPPRDAAKSLIRVQWPSGMQVEIPLTASRDTIDQVLRALSQLAVRAQERSG